MYAYVLMGICMSISFGDVWIWISKSMVAWNMIKM